MVSIGVINPADEPAQVLSTLAVEADPSLQYGRRIWMPPRSKRMTWFGMLIPADVPPDTSLLPVRSLLVDESQGSDVLIKSPGGQIYHTGILPINRHRLVTGTLLDAMDDEPRWAVATMRDILGLEGHVAGMGIDPLPVNVEFMRALDQLAVSSDEFVKNAALVVAIRQWLHDGGRLWIMLDQVEPSTVSLLLGDAFRLDIVDKTELTSVKVVSANEKEWQNDTGARHFDDPVEFVRVILEDQQVHFTVDGWPAAFFQRAGRGQVLFTTLGARGWYRERTKDDPRAVATSAATTWIALPHLARLATEFLRARPPPTLAPEDFRQFTSNQVGYRIIKRADVVSILGGFCVLLVIGGVWLGRAGRLERLAWMGPLAAAVAAAMLAIVGFRSRNAVPPTVVTSQLVEVSSGINDASVTGLVAVYNHQKTTVPLGARQGGIFMPDVRGQAGTTRRMVWDDLDKWYWDRLELPVGIQLVSFAYGTTLDTPGHARASFGPDGIVGSLSSGSFAELSDAVIATPTGRSMAAVIESDGAFAASADAVLPPDRYIAGAVLNDKQRTRQEMYRKLVGSGSGKNKSDSGQRYPDRATLLFWASPLDDAFTSLEDARAVGSALVAVPLLFDAPAPGTHVRIPAPWLPYASVSGPGQMGISPTYDSTRGQWVGPLTAGSTTFLRFDIPSYSLPLQIDRAELSVAIKAPSRQLDVMGIVGDKLVELHTRNSPVGKLRFSIDRADVLTVDETGGLVFVVKVGDFQGRTTGSIQTEGWIIDDLYLELWGQTLSENNKE